MHTEYVTHNKIRLALHHLRSAEESPDPQCRPLLLLHGLGEQSSGSVPQWAAAWPGPIAALDFTGHGASTVPRGGGYSSEMLLADADAALAALNPQVEVEVEGLVATPPVGGPGITVLGRGLGAYIALQLAGARASQVHGAILCDGPGLAGGATEPTSMSFFALPSDGQPPDPYAMVELGRDLRPPDYATSFVRLAVTGSELDQPITVCAVFRPAWLEAACGEHGVSEATLSEALSSYAALR
jgi:pimeloyl-ACP methyl ester carboxylesterase